MTYLMYKEKKIITCAFQVKDVLAYLITVYCTTRNVPKVGALHCSSDSELPAKNVSRGKLIGQGDGTSGLDRVLFDCDCMLEILNYPHKIIQALFITIRCYKDFVICCDVCLHAMNFEHDDAMHIICCFLESMIITCLFS